MISSTPAVYDFTKKVVLITGSSRGIGAAMAKCFGKAGATVVINYLRSKSEADAVAAEINSSSSGRALCIQADVSKVSEISKLFQESLAAFQGIDIVINNAAIFETFPIGDVTEEVFDRCFNMNVKGVFFLCQQAAKILPQNGRIINFSSVVTKRISGSVCCYAATRGAVEQITKSLAVELAPRNITVNTLSPGYTTTELLGPLDAHHAQVGKEASPFKRLGTPEDIAEVAMWLASDGARWITGQNIQAGGGMAMT